MPLTYSAPAATITLRIIESYGIDPLPLFKKLCIDPGLIGKPRARFSYTRIDDLWYEACTIADDPAFGLRAAKYWHPSNLGALGYAWLASDNLHSALQRMARYMAMLTEGASLTIEEEGDIISAQLHYKPVSRQQPTRTDSFMAMLLAMCRFNCGENFRPAAIHLKHPAPADSSAFDALFQCPVHFASSRDSFDVAREIAERPLATASTELARINDQTIIDTLAGFQSDSIESRVKNEMLKLLSSGKVTDEAIAKALRMTSRSLQRKLKEEGTSFREIHNELRRDLAEKYLREGSMHMSEIAFNLGFAEYSSFSRAFKRWTGMSPNQFSKENAPV